MSNNRDFEDIAGASLKWTDENARFKKNETDYEQFKRLQERDRQRFNRRYQQRRAQIRKQNLVSWMNFLPERWKGADLKTLDTPEAKHILAELDKHKKPVSFFLHGETGVGKTYHAYAILKEYIKREWITPGQIMRDQEKGNLLSEGRLISYAKTGFEGTNRFEKMLDKGYKVIFLDDLGRGAGSIASDKRKEVWDRLTDYAYSEGAMFILTSNFPFNNEAVTDSFTAPSLDRMMLLTNGRRMHFKGDNYRIKLAQQEQK